MKRRIAIVLTAILMVSSAFGQFGGGQKNKNQPQLRELTGEVLDRNDLPLDGAIVYLKNTRTLVVRTFITGQDGKYRFPGLAQNVDYDVYAQREGRRSDSKKLSSFDSRSQANINLRLETGK